VPQRRPPTSTKARVPIAASATATPQRDRFKPKRGAVITDSRLEEFANEIGERQLVGVRECRQGCTKFDRYSYVQRRTAPSVHSAGHTASPDMDDTDGIDKGVWA
jgi:hypothetical protein